MTSGHHVAGQRVRSIFDDREGVVIESDPIRTLIEFQDYDEDEGEAFTHRKWLPTRHWRNEALKSSDPQPLGSAREATEDGQHKTNPDPAVRHGRDSQGGER